jgi:HNH endonuclease
MPLQEVTCEICSARFKVKPYRQSTARFCSRSCKSSWVARHHLNNGPKPWASKNLDGHRHKSPTRFKPGLVPWNKDLKGIHLSPSSEFQKGRASDTRADIGEVRIRIFKKDHPRAFIKVAQPNKWKAFAVFVWEKINGQLPKGYVVHHKDRNTLNDEIENLQAMTRAEHIEEHRKDFL